MGVKDATLNAALQGQSVTAVTFFHDYFQVQTSEATINLYWAARIVSAEWAYGFTDSGFAAAARSLVSRTIRGCRGADE